MRLTHAIARYHLLRGGMWDEHLGYPVNQEDMAGTNLAFSLIIIRGLRKTGVTVSTEEQEAFLHHWSVISYLMGIRKSLIPANGKEANMLEKMIRQRNFRHSGHGQALLSSLIDAFREAGRERMVSSSEIRQIMRFLLNDEAAQVLGLQDVEVSQGMGILVSAGLLMSRFVQPD